MFSLGLSLALAPLSLMFADIVQIYQAVLTAMDVPDADLYPLSALPDPIGSSSSRTP